MENLVILRSNLPMDISNLFHCLNVDTDIPKSEWVQKKKDPNKTKTWFLMVLKKWCYITCTISKVTFHRNSALC